MRFLTYKVALIIVRWFTALRLKYVFCLQMWCRHLWCLQDCSHALLLHHITLIYGPADWYPSSVPSSSTLQAATDHNPFLKNFIFNVQPRGIWTSIFNEGLNWRSINIWMRSLECTLVPPQSIISDQTLKAPSLIKQWCSLLFLDIKGIVIDQKVAWWEVRAPLCGPDKSRLQWHFGCAFFKNVMTKGISTDMRYGIVAVLLSTERLGFFQDIFRHNNVFLWSWGQRKRGHWWIIKCTFIHSFIQKTQKLISSQIFLFVCLFVCLFFWVRQKIRDLINISKQGQMRPNSYRMCVFGWIWLEAQEVRRYKLSWFEDVSHILGINYMSVQN